MGELPIPTTLAGQSFNLLDSGAAVPTYLKIRTSVRAQFQRLWGTQPLDHNQTFIVQMTCIRRTFKVYRNFIYYCRVEVVQSIQYY